MKLEEKEILRKKRVLEYAEACGNVLKTCRHFGVSRSNFYIWRAPTGVRAMRVWSARSPSPGHTPIRPQPRSSRRSSTSVKYHLGPIRIVWYMRRYHDIRISDAGVYRVLRRNGLSRLPRKAGTRAVHTKRYQKQVPGHHIQIDVKFLIFKGKGGSVTKRYQYTAIDDATRIRALKVYSRHNQANAIDFVEYVVEKFPFRIQCIRTDRGHEFQAKFHWHVEDRGIRHAYIKPRSPQLNGKVERSHRSDQEEFYQLLDYTDDVDLKRKLADWEKFYNFSRPHGAFNGQTPYEALREKL